jgi:hypothetical protein
MSVESNHILDDLTRRQFLHPHLSIADGLAQASAELGFCPRAAAHALEWLEMNPAQSIGRLRRTELTQLARSIYRFWKHALAIETEQSSR